MDLKQSDLINVNQRFRPRQFKAKPPIDIEISKIVGKTVLAQDPRLFAIIIKYKNGKSGDSTVPDNFMQNPAFIKELKETFI